MTASTTTKTATTIWTIDSAHSNVEFSVKHMMISTVKGQFSTVEGTIEFDPARPEAARVDASIDVASVTTFNQMRDNHLRTNDFFNAEQWPAITFKSTNVEPMGADRFRILGDLTIRDTSKPVVLDAELDGIVAKDAFGKRRVAFTATTDINRKEFGVNWNAVVEGVGVTVSDKVKITLHIAAVQENAG